MHARRLEAWVLVGSKKLTRHDSEVYLVELDLQILKFCNTSEEEWYGHAAPRMLNLRLYSNRIHTVWYDSFLLLYWICRNLLIQVTFSVEIVGIVSWAVIFL